MEDENLEALVGLGLEPVPFIVEEEVELVIGVVVEFSRVYAAAISVEDADVDFGITIEDPRVIVALFAVPFLGEGAE